MIMRPIGVIYSSYETKDECPIQPLYASNTIGRVEVFNECVDGLENIGTFSIYICFISLITYIPFFYPR